MIGPLGGLGPLEVPRERHAELFTILAGPLVNLALMQVVLPVLLLTGVSVMPLVSLLAPVGLLEGPWWAVPLKLTLWINGVLFIVNMLPALPLDGARLLRTLLWPSFDYRVAGHVAVRISKITALLICVLAWLVRDEYLAGVLPTWLPLVLLAVWIYCSAV